ncbi:hypothetical protein CANARDRAFT_29436 [[Candida] arabinofermentans NRRL YB-2248]|uniref:Uncharacterized protein n=1 Tax=[Candida] arabinofermentans NRRL YB-2248 TaxID=983967 RepID=A0A1E4SWW0_9ASCO|nr:hypothetical protein CANARDRAFT_29436 [[Candida] arabinofermentans NRRL YB-2248]
MDDEGAPFDFDTLQVGNSELLVQIHPNFYAIAEKKKLSIVTFVSNEEKESTTPKQLTTVNFESRIKNILVPEDHDKQDVDYKAKDVGCYVILEGSEPWFIPLEKKKEDDDEFLF